MELLEQAEKLADAGGAEKPPGLTWGLKAVKPDLRSYGGYRWPWPGAWATCDAPDASNTGPCPERSGDGLCVAKTWRGMASGGYPAATLLLVGYEAEDVLGQDADKVRASRVYVRDVVDGTRLVREHGTGADLTGANLSGADLSWANLSGADLSGANLYRVNLTGADLYRAVLSWAVLSGAGLYGANLTGADLSGADLSGAMADEYTRWPTGFDPSARELRT